MRLSSALSHRAPRLVGLALSFALLPSLAMAQATLTVSSEVGTILQTARIQLSGSSGLGIAGLGFDITFDPAEVMVDDVRVGPAGSAANKFVTYSFPSPGLARVLVFGVNQTTFADGVVAFVDVSLQGTPTNNDTTSLGLTRATASNSTGQSTIPLTLQMGTLTFRRNFGDLVGGENVDALDLQVLINIILGSSPFDQAADLDRSGSVNALDLQQQINVILGFPAIQIIDPAIAAPGQTIDIFGANFPAMASNLTVNFNGGAMATPTSISSNRLSVVVPANATTGLVSLRNNITASTSNLTQLTIQTDVTTTPVMGLGAPFGITMTSATTGLYTDRDAGTLRSFDSVAGTTASVATGLSSPQDVIADATNAFVVERGSNRIVSVPIAGGASTLIVGGGLGAPGYDGEGLAANTSRLAQPSDITRDGGGLLVIADEGNHIVRRVNAMGNLVTIAGTPVTQGSGGDGGLATSATLSLPRGVAFDGTGRLFILCIDRIRVVDTNGMISTLASNQVAPERALVTSSGALVFTNPSLNRIFMVPSGSSTVQVYAGTGALGTDDGALRGADFSAPSGIALTGTTLFVTDRASGRIRSFVAP